MNRDDHTGSEKAVLLNRVRGTWHSARGILLFLIHELCWFEAFFRLWKMHDVRLSSRVVHEAMCSRTFTDYWISSPRRLRWLNVSQLDQFAKSLSRPTMLYRDLVLWCNITMWFHLKSLLHDRLIQDLTIAIMTAFPGGLEPNDRIFLSRTPPDRQGKKDCQVDT